MAQINKMLGIGKADGTNVFSSFVSIIIGGYFGSQVLYNIFNIQRHKPYREEIHDLVMLISLGGILFAYNNYQTKINPMFYIGFIPGLFGAFVYSKLEFYKGHDKKIWNNIVMVMFILAGVAVLFSLYTSFENGRALGHLMYIISVLVMVAMIIHTKQSEDNTVLSKTPLNFGLTNVAFILLLMIQYAGNDVNVFTLISNIIQGFIMGVFVSGMAYFGIEYIVKDDEAKIVTTDKSGDDNNTPSNKIPADYYIRQRQILEDIQSMKWTTSFIISIIILIVVMFHISGLKND